MKKQKSIFVTEGYLLREVIPMLREVIPIKFLMEVFGET